jgi:hypothetical protein
MYLEETPLEPGKDYYISVQSQSRAVYTSAMGVMGPIRIEPPAETVDALAGSISVDGQVDAVWSTTPKRIIAKTTGSIQGDADASATWQALWDENYLYVLVDVTDDVIKKDSIHPWQDDGVELFLDVGGEGASAYGSDDYQYVVPALSNTAVVGVNSAARVPGIRVASVSRNGGYRVEMAIPWHSEAGALVSNGDTVGLEVQVNDDDDGGAREGKLLWWDGQDIAWRDPSSFARATLAGTPEAPQVTLKFAQTLPVIDGAADPQWAYAGSQPISKVIRGGATNKLASWRALSTTNHLYLLVEVEDEALVSDSANRWEDDSVELFLDLRGNGGDAYDANDVQLVFRWNDPHAGVGVNSVPVGTSALTFPMVDTAHAYRLEAAVPWSALPRRPGIGTLFGIDVHVNDDDDGGARETKHAWWSPSDDTWRWPYLMGKATLTTEIPSAPGAMLLVP